MAPVSHYALRQLARARRTEFEAPVTGYLINARMVACCCVGQVYGHAKARPDGWLRDGHTIRTSDIFRVEERERHWICITASGSFYVIVSFAREGGRRSLDAFLKISLKGVHPTARHCQ
jgi:hypothetical protein